jgi:hypothetical protein
MTLSEAKAILFRYKAHRWFGRGSWTYGRGIGPLTDIKVGVAVAMVEVRRSPYHPESDINAGYYDY